SPRGRPVLEMDAAQHLVPGVGMVVLDELVRQPRLGKVLPVIVLQEEAALVPEDFRLDYHHPFQLGLSNRDQRRRSSSACWSPVSGTRTWVMSSRARMVTAWSWAVSKSTVTAKGVPISSWRR